MLSEVQSCQVCITFRTIIFTDLHSFLLLCRIHWTCIVEISWTSLGEMCAHPRLSNKTNVTVLIWMLNLQALHLVFFYKLLWSVMTVIILKSYNQLLLSNFQLPVMLSPWTSRLVLEYENPTPAGESKNNKFAAVSFESNETRKNVNTALFCSRWSTLLQLAENCTLLIHNENIYIV